MTWNYVMLMLGYRDTHVLPNLVQTCFVKGQNGDVHLNYRDTNVVTFHPDNTFTLNSGGYRTKTTLSRLRKFGPLNIASESGKWILNSQEGEFEFFDGIRVDYWGKVETKPQYTGLCPCPSCLRCSCGDPDCVNAENHGEIEICICEHADDHYATEVTVDNQIVKMHL